METEGSTIKLNIICPDSNCGTKKEVTVPADNLKQSESGIVTISISKGIVCDHSFQVFVDMNGRVRGYKKPDFELSFAQDQEPDDPTDTTQYEEPDRILQGVQVILGDEMFYKTIRSALYNLPTYVITDIPSIHSIVDSFRRILKPYVDEFTICTLQEYNRDYRGQLASSKDGSSFVIAIDQRIIINQIYDNKYDEKKFALEKSMLAIVDPSRSNEQTIQSLHVLFDSVLDSTNRIKIDMEKDKLEARKDVKSRVSKMVNKKLILDVETVEGIITSRYDFDVDAYFKAKSRASEWGKGILDLTG
ncbi:MAG: hypothetical protein ACXADC_09550 [Candidatus Thorarchaeota archaeon]|jgi:hypothetical protein